MAEKTIRCLACTNEYYEPAAYLSHECVKPAVVVEEEALARLGNAIDDVRAELDDLDQIERELLELDFLEDLEDDGVAIEWEATPAATAAIVFLAGMVGALVGLGLLVEAGFRAVAKWLR